MNVYEGDKPLAWLLNLRESCGARDEAFARVTELAIEMLRRREDGRLYLCWQPESGQVTCVLKKICLDVLPGEMPGFLYRMSMADHVDVWGWEGKYILLAATVENVFVDV